jgi:hypothetical protein
MMHGHEKSDLAIVAAKSANKAEQLTAEASVGANAAEPVERRAGAKGNADRQTMPWAQSQTSMSHALERIRRVCRHTPEAGAVCGKAARTVLCGGRAVKRASLPRLADNCCTCSGLELALLAHSQFIGMFAAGKS